MAFRRNVLLRFFVLGAASLVLVGIAAAAMPLVKGWWQLKGTESTVLNSPETSIRIVAGQSNTFILSPSVMQSLKTETATVEKAWHRKQLRLSGSLALDSNYMVRLHSRFAGEVIDPGYIHGALASVSAADPELHSLRVGDKVEKGQLLAVVWSKELGEKKSELVDALSQMAVDQQILKSMQDYVQSIPIRSIREQEAKVSQDRNAVLRVERTLRVWRLEQQEIDEVKKEAQRLLQDRTAGLPVKEKEWARVAIKAPFAGTIMEKNINGGDYVDTSAVLYQIADLTHLTVWAHVYEEDLPGLQALTPQERRWNVQLPTDPAAQPLPGTIATIGNVIDPTQHTAVVMGHVTNVHGQMRAGQYITAVVELPAPPDEVEIPTSALIEDGSASVVIVQVDADRREFALRRVAVTRRTSDWIGLRAEPKPDEHAQGLRPGERVVTGGALELASALKDIQGSMRQ